MRGAFAHDRFTLGEEIAHSIIHGLVTLEILSQLDWIYPDPDAFYAAEVEHILDRILRAGVGCLAHCC